MSLQTAVAVGFGAACVAVYLGALVQLLRTALAARALARRAQALRPADLPAQLRVARADAARAANALRQMPALGARAAVAAASIAHSVSIARDAVLRMRAAFGV